jgi:hypothetical protein
MFFPLLTAGLFAASAAAQSTTAAPWPTKSFKSEPTFSPPVLAINKTGEPIAPGYIFFAPDGRPPIQVNPLIMGTNGHLIWNGPLEHAFNFGMQHYKGNDVLVYWNGTVYSEPVGRGNGAVYILDNTYSIIETVTLPGNFVEQVPGATFPSSIDLHELNITPQGTLLVTANNVTTTDLTSIGGPAQGWIVDSMFYEIDIATNEVLFEWSALEHLTKIPLTSTLYPLGFAGFTGQNQTVPWGYTHINAVTKYGSGYLASFRYLCSIIAFDKTGAIDWILQGVTGGDFTLGADTSFCYQHDIRVIANSTTHLNISMHDNANSPVNANSSATPDGPAAIRTSGLELSIDLKKKSVSKIARFFNPANPIFSPAQGNFQRILSSALGNVFIGHGILGVFEEFTKAGKIAMTVQFAALTQGAGLSYRAFHQPWIGCPTTPPAMFAAVENGTTAVYASWNGATDYKVWTVYAGSSDVTLSAVAKVARNGLFETRIEVPGSPTVVQVEALNCGTRVKSEVFTL